MTSTLTQFPNQNIALHDLLNELIQLKNRIISETDLEMNTLHTEETSPEHLSSIYNMWNYVVMRREDLIPLQQQLAHSGLSSLGRGEPHVLANIDGVINILSQVLKQHDEHHHWSPPDYESGKHLLKQRCQQLFGPTPANRAEYIMVTMPEEAASDYAMVAELIKSGMDVARINCAHYDEVVWQNMIQNIRKAAQAKNRQCKIFMDLAGHKIRTDKIISRKQHPTKPNHDRPRVHKDDRIVLSRMALSPKAYSMIFGSPVKATITSTNSAIFDRISTNQTVWIDDGKIGTRIVDLREGAALLQVTHVGPKGTRLKAEKGLNFPQTHLDLPALSDKDIQDLGFVSQHADIVGLSFVENASGLQQLKNLLIEHGKPDLPIVAKIETVTGVKELPNIIAHSLARNMDLGVLIARGDLAIELGSVRMAEAQEEILWLCEAAHTPVIWATQVLESLAKEGQLSRPEITDAASSVRADCVMLNKGPYITNAVTLLGDVLQCMEAHQFKKFSQLRALNW